MTNSKQTTTFENVQVGDKVYTIGLGWGKVVSVSYTMDMRPLQFVVYFDSISLVFNTLGQQISRDVTTTKQTVFWDEIIVTAPPKPRIIPAKDVLVACDGYLRYSAGAINDSGDLWCYPDGRTSATREGRNLTAWANWEVVTDV